jgi:uncharacterized protein
LTLKAKKQHVIELLRAAAGEGRVAVAFSGGVDSTLLLALAREALGGRVVAVTAVSDSLARDELELCRRLASGLDVPLRLLRTREMEREGYRANAGDRCYHCKTELFERVAEEVLSEEGVSAVAYGATADDVGDHRPGMRAAEEHAVLAPLLEAGLGKAEVRALSQELGLETWDKPAQPCLASRIPYGQAVTREALARIDAGEALLRGLGFRELRVRHHEQARGGPIARLEVPLSDLPRLLEPGVREEVCGGLRGLGFQYVALDLEGFRSGSLNDLLGRKLPLAAGDPT